MSTNQTTHSSTATELETREPISSDPQPPAEGPTCSICFDTDLHNAHRQEDGPVALRFHSASSFITNTLIPVEQLFSIKPHTPRIFRNFETFALVGNLRPRRTFGPVAQRKNGAL